VASLFVFSADFPIGQSKWFDQLQKCALLRVLEMRDDMATQFGPRELRWLQDNALLLVARTDRAVNHLGLKSDAMNEEAL
jgi:hypothetical protein